MDLGAYREAGKILYDSLHLPTYPVAIKYIKSEDEIPEKGFRPSAKGQKLSLCQTFTYARRWGRHSAMTEKDNFCVPSSAGHQWVSVSKDEFVESQVRQGWHKDRAAEENRNAFNKGLFSSTDGKNNLRSAREYIGLVCSPITETLIEPDSVIVYGDGGHITHIIHALCYNSGIPLTSSFDGFGESCVKGGLIPFITGKPQVIIPGMGDRKFSGTTENEIAIGFPGSMLNTVVDCLFKSGGSMNLGQPEKVMLPTGLTESVTPGFAFLRKELDKKNA